MDVNIDEKSSLLNTLGIPTFAEESLTAGHNACPGCGSTIALRMVLDAIGPKTYYFVPAGCASLYFGPDDTIASSTPMIHTAFAASFAQAEGMAHALELQGRTDEHVAVWAGDGATYDIGMGGLSGVAARNGNVIVICDDNEGYQNTGGHSSTATSTGALTRSTQPNFSLSPLKKDIIEVLAAHRVPYLATICAAYPEDLKRKIEKAKSIYGFKFLLLLTSCVAWGHESQVAVKLVRMSVETGFFPLYEIENGNKYNITHEPQFLPLEEFTKLQRRFYGIDLDPLKEQVKQKWDYLKARVA